mgnify:CR=1 FL=1
MTKKFNITYYKSQEDYIAKGINIEAIDINDAYNQIKDKNIILISIVDLSVLSEKKTLVANEYFKNQIY